MREYTIYNDTNKQVIKRNILLDLKRKVREKKIEIIEDRPQTMTFHLGKTKPSYHYCN